MTTAKKAQFSIMIGIAVMFYLADCLVAHGRHPEVSVLASGIRNPGPFGICATVAVLGAGLVSLLKRN